MGSKSCHKIGLIHRMVNSLNDLGQKFASCDNSYFFFLHALRSWIFVRVLWDCGKDKMMSMKKGSVLILISWCNNRKKERNCTKDVRDSATKWCPSKKMKESVPLCWRLSSFQIYLGWSNPNLPESLASVNKSWNHILPQMQKGSPLEAKEGCLAWWMGGRLIAGNIDEGFFTAWNC